MGFEPTVLVRGRQFSRLVHSTALPPLRGCGLRAQATGKPDSGPEQDIQFASMARNPALRRTPAMDFWAGLLAGAGIAHSANWMTAIKLAGGCYLPYLGIRGLRSGACRAGRDAGSRHASFATASDCRRPSLQRVQFQGAYLLPRAVHRCCLRGCRCRPC